MAHVITDSDALFVMTYGAQKLADLMSPNFGPNGRNIIYDQLYDIPLVINTGQKVLSDFSLNDHLENIGATLLKNAALEVNRQTGDGTIATIIMADAVLRKGQALIGAGVNPIRLRTSIQKAIPVAEQAILHFAAPVKNDEHIEKIAAAAADSQPLGKLVAQAFQAAGPEGIITVTDSQEAENRLDICEGIRYDYGLYSASYINDPIRQAAIFHHPCFLLVNQKISRLSDIEKLLDDVMRQDVPLVIIPESIDDEINEILLANTHRGAFQAAVAYAPGHGEIRRRNMQALAAQTGAILIDENCGLSLKDCGLEICGQAEYVKLDKETTYIQGLTHANTKAVSTLKRMLATAMEEDSKAGIKVGEMEKWHIARAILEEGMSTIIAGGMTEYEMFENKHQLENAVSAVYSALRAGIVEGGGKAYLAALPAIDEQLKQCSKEDRFGLLCVREALLAPEKIIRQNSEDQSSSKSADVFDSAEIVCLSFKIAAEIASTLLTVAAAVTS